MNGYTMAEWIPANEYFGKPKNYVIGEQIGDIGVLTLVGRLPRMVAIIREHVVVGNMVSPMWYYEDTEHITRATIDACLDNTRYECPPEQTRTLVPGDCFERNDKKYVLVYQRGMHGRVFAVNMETWHVAFVYDARLPPGDVISERTLRLLLGVSRLSNVKICKVMK